MRARFSALSLPYLHLLKGIPVIKVAGTNGKGSVCAMLEACLASDGRRVGLFTSPHLSRIEERFRIGGSEVSPETLDRLAGQVLEVAQRMVAKHGNSHAPSFFEALIVIAILLFHEQQVDVAVFEAGVGGYNDATSLLSGPVSIITSIALDHQGSLGNSLGAIAADKAGIATSGTHLILGPEIPPALQAIIEKDACAREVSLAQASLEGLSAIRGNLSKPTGITLGLHGKTMHINLPLLGRHQVSNFATVAAVVETLERLGIVRGAHCLQGVEKTWWPGRLEVRDAPRVILDAAHNEHGIHSLVDSLEDLVPYSERILLYGASTGKDYASCLPHLPRLAPRVYLVDGFYRAEQASVIAAALPEACGYVGSFPTPRDSIEFFINDSASSNRMLIATGSIFMIGELISCLDANSSLNNNTSKTNPAYESS